MATILDVANEANVSTATVSRVLNGSYAVTAAKRERVMAAIERVGYQIPNRIKLNQLNQQAQDAAQAQKKSLILVICSNYIHPILYGFQRAASDLNYQVVSAHYENAAEFDHLAGLIASLSPILAGIALINCADNSRKFQELLEPYPVVQIGEPIMENVPNFVVYNDEIKMAEDAAEYLIHLGCRKIGMLTTEPTASTSLFFKKKRLNGYYLALMNHDFPVDQTLVEFVDVSIEGGGRGHRRDGRDRPGRGVRDPPGGEDDAGCQGLFSGQQRSLGFCAWQLSLHRSPPRRNGGHRRPCPPRGDFKRAGTGLSRRDSAHAAQYAGCMRLTPLLCP